MRSANFPPTLSPVAPSSAGALGILQRGRRLRPNHPVPRRRRPQRPRHRAAIRRRRSDSCSSRERRQRGGSCFSTRRRRRRPPKPRPTSSAKSDAARERFVTQFCAAAELARIPGPVVQQFIPAILPLLRIGIRVIGRQRVVNFLASYLARLIQPYVGPAAATTLSRALVDVGLRLITLGGRDAKRRRRSPPAPSPQRSRMRSAGSASFGFEHFDNLDESRDQQQLARGGRPTRPSSRRRWSISRRSSSTCRGSKNARCIFEVCQQDVWVARPTAALQEVLVDLRGYAHAADARLRSAPSADQPLDAFLRARGVTAAGHCRRSTSTRRSPGTTLSRIAVLEKRVPGLGSGSRRPLVEDPSADDRRPPACCCREPGLGRDVDARLAAIAAPSRRRAALLLPRDCRSGGGGRRRSVAGPPSEVNVTIDLRASQVARQRVFFSEADAQRIVGGRPDRGRDDRGPASLRG